MNETLKKNLKRSLAAFLAVVLVAMPGISGAADLEEAETAPATEIINEAAEAPAAPEAEVPEVLPDPKSSETNKAADKADFDVEKAYEEYLSFKEEEQREEYLNSISAKNREELEKYIADKEAEANAKDAALAAFAAKVEAAGKITDIEEAYEHYLSLAEEWQKEQYLNSLSAEDRATLKQYIADKEAEAALAELAAEPETAIDENAEEAPAEEAAEENAEATEATEEPEVTEETEEPPAEEPAEEAEDAEEPEGEPAEEPEEEPEEEPTEEPEEEPAEEPEEDPDRVISFGSAHIEGEWAGRDTKAIRTLTIHVYIDGALAGTCSTAANKSVAFFAVYAGDNEITDVTANSWAVTSSGTAWCVDMYEDHNVMVDVNLSSLPAEEAEEAEDTEPAEEVTEETEETELAEEAIEEAEETEPTEEITEETEETEPAEEAESEEPTEEITEETEELTEEEDNSALTEEVPEDAVLFDTLIDMLDPNRRIDIYASWEGEQVENGTEVTLTAVLYGYDNAVYTLRWQKAESATEEIPEESWTDLEGMTESTMTFVFSEDSADDYYRVIVNITDVTDITDSNEAENEAAPEEMLSTQ